MRRPALFLGLFGLSLFGCRDKTKTSPPDAAVVAHAVQVDAATSATPIDVVANASPGAVPESDAAPATDPHDVLDGAAMRTAHKARIKGDVSPVTVLEGGTPKELGQKLCEQVVPQKPAETPILIKPNFGGFDWFKDPAKNNGDDGIKGRTTDPEFVRGIVQCLKARGHTKITVAEGWDGTHANWNKLAKMSGYQKMTEEEGVTLVAFDDDGVFDKEGTKPAQPLLVTGMEQTNVPKLLAPRALADHLKGGLFISAPKVKAHRFGVISMAIKGMQGTVMTSDGSPAMHQKKQMHKEISSALSLLQKDRPEGEKAYLASLEIFAERMSDVLEIEAPDVVLAEGAPMEGGDGFGKRWPSAESVAIGGTNPILVDRVGAQMLGLWDNGDLAAKLGGHRTSPLLETAAKRFEVDISAPKVIGNGAALLDKPRPVHFVSMSGFSLHSDKSPMEGAEGPPREVHAVHASAPMTDATWAAVPATHFSTDWSGAETGIGTDVRVAWAKDALYMQWKLSDAGFNVDESKPTDVDRPQLYNEDCTEVFIGTQTEDPHKYYEIEIGPLGHFLDLTVDPKAKLDVKTQIAWSSGAKIVTNPDRAAHKDTIDVTFTSPDIVSALKSGASLPLAFYRMEGKPRKYLAWSPTKTPKPDFHVPSAFGRLILDP